MPFDQRVGAPDEDALATEQNIANREIAIWMAQNGYDGNPEGEDTADWHAGHLGPNDEPLPEYGINFIEIETLEGTMQASPGDYIIKGVQGEFYPCKPEIFEATYEAVDD